MQLNCLALPVVMSLGLTGCETVENFSSTLEMEVSGEVLTLNGIINTRALGQFDAVLAENPQVQLIILDQVEGSTDGDVVAEMGYLIRDLGLATRMNANSAVYSGGVDLFLGGVDRVVMPGAIVGVHEWATGFGTGGRDIPRDSNQHEPTRGYIADMLGSDAFYWFTLEAAPFDGVHEMTRAELVQFGVVTR